jgi:hypothetical protein
VTSIGQVCRAVHSLLWRQTGNDARWTSAEAQEQVLFLVRDAGRGKVLYDTLEMEALPVDVPWAQRALDEKLGVIKLERAIVVPNSKLAYLARIAFGERDYRLFYNNKVAAIKWLAEH